MRPFDPQLSDEETRTTEAQLFKINSNLKPPSKAGIFTPATMRNGFAINLQFDTQTTEITSKKHIIGIFQDLLDIHACT